MWSPKKRKGITLPSGKSIEIGFTTAWRRDKDEVVIITEDGKIVLDGKNELFLEISASNVDPIKVQIVPDFKNRVLNFVEVIDINAQQKTGENKGKISLAGISSSKEEAVTIGEYLKNWDEDIEKFGKHLKDHGRSTKIFVTLEIALIFFNLYLFITENGLSRYLNLIIVIFLGFLTYNSWSKHRKLCKDYNAYKDMRSRAFEVVKDK